MIRQILVDTGKIIVLFYLLSLSNIRGSLTSLNAHVNQKGLSEIERFWLVEQVTGSFPTLKLQRPTGSIVDIAPPFARVGGKPLQLCAASLQHRPGTAG